ncbi:MAG: ABC transporter substrate-binding protein, partial [Oscillospiraceae bacterium]
GQFLADTIKKLESGEKVDAKTFMAEPWYVNEDILKDVTYTNSIGKEVTEPLVVTTQAIADASY